MDNLYLLSGNSYLIKENLKILKRRLGIRSEELDVSALKEIPEQDELWDMLGQVPFMSDRRMIIVEGTKQLAAKDGEAEGKKPVDYLERLPESGVLVIIYPGKPDKRRALYKAVVKFGRAVDFPDPDKPACVSYAISQAKSLGSEIKKSEAEKLVNMAGCDYSTISNEVKKIAVLTRGKEIKEEDIDFCVSKSLEYNVFDIHSNLAYKKADEAFKLLSEILTEEAPEALVGLIAYNFREMYKVRSMMDMSYSKKRISEVLKSKENYIHYRMEQCSRFSGEDIRNGLSLLGDLDYCIKSGKKDAVLSLPSTLTKIYKL